MVWRVEENGGNKRLELAVERYITSGSIIFVRAKSDKYSTADVGHWPGREYQARYM